MTIGTKGDLIPLIVDLMPSHCSIERGADTVTMIGGDGEVLHKTAPHCLDGTLSLGMALSLPRPGDLNHFVRTTSIEPPREL